MQDARLQSLKAQARARGQSEAIGICLRFRLLTRIFIYGFATFTFILTLILRAPFLALCLRYRSGFVAKAPQELHGGLRGAHFVNFIFCCRDRACPVSTFVPCFTLWCFVLLCVLCIQNSSVGYSQL